MRSSTPLRSARWRASVASPSLRSIIAVAPAAASARPSREPRPRPQVARRTSAASAGVPPLSSSPPPGLGAAQLAGHADEVARPRAVAARRARPPIGPAGHRHGQHEHRAAPPRRRPRSSRRVSLASSSIAVRPARARSSKSGGQHHRHVRLAGSAPIAARSDSAVASAFQPTSRRRVGGAPEVHAVDERVDRGDRERAGRASPRRRRRSSAPARPLRSVSAASIARDQLELAHGVARRQGSARCGGRRLPCRSRCRSRSRAGRLGLHLLGRGLVRLVERRLLVVARVVLLVGAGAAVGAVRVAVRVVARARTSRCAAYLPKNGRELGRLGRAAGSRRSRRRGRAS